MQGSVRATLLALCVLAAAVVARGTDARSPEDVLRAYLGAVKDQRFDDAYALTSKAMRQGKTKDAWVKDSKSTMAFADVKIFSFSVYPGKVEGDKALVPNILESQDKFVNTLGLTEHELYTLVREDGGWKIDQQLLVEPPDIPKWFPKDAAAPAGR
jgi:hypothetical protein